MVLQSSTATKWVKVATGKTSRTGKFSFRVTLTAPAGTRQVRYRVKAPRVKAAGVTLRSVTTPTRSVTVQWPTQPPPPTQTPTPTPTPSPTPTWTPPPTPTPTPTPTVDTTPPDSPWGLTATPGDTQVALTWNAVDASDLAGYHVYVSTDYGMTSSRVTSAPVSGTRHTVTGLINTTDYVFTVTSIDTTENESGESTGAYARPSAPIPSTWTSVSAGEFSTCGVGTNGTGWCWGRLAGSDWDAAPLPRQVAGSWKSMSTERFNSCGVKTDDTGWCWGSNHYGQLGTGTTTDSGAPQQVAGLWAFVAAGLQHTCGVQTDGSGWCWGYNVNGQLGDGTTTDSATPRQVEGTWRSVNAGDFHSCGVQTNGTGWCWGDNNYGKLGNGTTTDSSSPVQVAGTWRELTAGSSHTCGVRTDGTGWCWGDNSNGELGDGTTSSRYVPKQVPGVWASLNAGSGHTCAVKTDGTGWCWGDNVYGEVRAGLAGDALTPLLVSSTSPPQAASTWQHLTPGESHSCGVQADGTAWCWGSNSYGKLGIGADPGLSHVPPVRVGN